jgi:3-phenylpropionate/trans-cinnamate dioxygenase ferredoxin reductase subunit
MNATPTIAIVGAGLAGASAALQLRADGFDGRIVLIGAEAGLPYERPGLSKGYLRGEEDRDALLVRDAAAYADAGIELLPETRIVALDLREHALVTDRDDRIAYDRLLLSPGSTPRRLDVPGANLPGIHLLRTIADADAIRTAASSAARAVIVGGGWIGAEVAASLRQLGLPVAMAAPSSVPLETVLGPEIGGVYRDLHADQGVELHLGQLVTGFAGQGHVSGVRTKAGPVIAGDLVVVGIGAVPETSLAEDAGLAVGNGIEVDQYLETSADGVFAAGDVAAAWHPTLGRRLRVEHWDNAKRQGRAAAANLLGRREPYDRLPYFYSDQYDLGMEYVGHADAGDEVVVRGDLAGREFIAFWLRDGRPVAAMNANVWKVNDDLRALIAAGRPIDRAALADPAIPLPDLAASAVPVGSGT